MYCSNLVRTITLTNYRVNYSCAIRIYLALPPLRDAQYPDS